MIIYDNVVITYKLIYNSLHKLSLIRKLVVYEKRRNNFKKH